MLLAQKNYTLEDFNFSLPEELIAQHPCAERDGSRMLVVSEDIKDDIFKNFLNYITPKDVIVFNNSKVIPAELYGSCHDRVHRVNLHKKIDDLSWCCFIKKSKYLNIGDKISFANDFDAVVSSKMPEGDVVLQFFCQESLDKSLIEYGQMPLPPYIKRGKGGEKEDLQNYQTIYAKKNGSVAAPTAGLHFSDQIIKQLESKTNLAFITLHVGAGTFLPVKTDDITQHKMHEEYFEISKEAADKINNVRASGGRVFAVGTTSLRSLEAAMLQQKKQGKEYLEAVSAKTDIFITPGYKFSIVDNLLTNFHLPKSTLFMLVSAFAGYENMHKAYKHAIENRYRFFSYGDCCLLKKIG